MKISPQELFEIIRTAEDKGRVEVTPAPIGYTPGTVRPGDIDPDELARLLAMVAKGHKIQAIKILRAVTGYGLGDAKAMVERYWGRTDG